MSPPRLIGAELAELMPPSTLTLDDVSRSLDHQLRMHGFDGRALEDARAAARNTIAVLWLELQNEKAARLAADAHAGDLARSLALRPCAWVEHDFVPEPLCGAHVCSRCGAIGGGRIEPEPEAAETRELDLSGGAPG